MATMASPSCLSTNHRTSISSSKPIPFSKSSSFPKCSALPRKLTIPTLQNDTRIMRGVDIGRAAIQAKELERKKMLMRAVAAEEQDTQLDSEYEDEDDQEDQRPVTAVVSQSDKLLMHFKADGILADSLLTKVTEALEELEDVSDVFVDTVEGVTTIGLVKETTIQATGVASGLVELLQGMEFKLQNLSLLFEDEEELQEGLDLSV